MNLNDLEPTIQHFSHFSMGRYNYDDGTIWHCFASGKPTVADSYSGHGQTPEEAVNNLLKDYEQK